MRTHRRRPAALVALGATLLLGASGCLSPSYTGLRNVYDADNAFRSWFAVCYDATVIAQGWPVPAVVAFQVDYGGVGWEVITTFAMPLGLVGGLVGGLLGAPFIAIAKLTWDEEVRVDSDWEWGLGPDGGDGSARGPPDE